ncbi:hypothetical protein ACFX15_029491 [Malus domestica]
MSSKLAKLGVAAVLAYGLFDAVEYTAFLVLAFLGYEKSIGKNPVAHYVTNAQFSFALFYGFHLDGNG